MINRIVIALCANSPIYAGRESPYCSAREGGMAAVAFMALFVLTYLALVRRVQNGRFRSLPKQPMPVPQ